MAMSTALPDPDTQPEFYTGVPFKRLIAWIIDVVLILSVTLLIGLLTLGIALIFFPFFYLVVAFLYRWLTMATGSATLGMRLMAMEIRNAHGARLDGGEALLHTLGYLVATIFVLVQLASIVMMAISPRNQGLHDLVLGTVAMNRPG